MDNDLPHASAPPAGFPPASAEHDNPFELLAEDNDEGHRWAFGTGFTDPLAGVGTTVPPGLDPGTLARCCLALGDDALIYSHRLQQWVTRLPELEEETAVANIALDLLGQARMLLSRAGRILGRTEDELAFFREEKEFLNVRLAEHADRDFAELTARLLIFSSWRLALFQRLAPSQGLPGSADPVLAAIAAKAVSELAYHRDYAAGWVIRLGDGTGYSRDRMRRALETLWPLVGELFQPDGCAALVPDGGSAEGGSADGDPPGDGSAVLVSRRDVDAVLDQVLAKAGLDRPDQRPLARVGGRAGRDGVHTEAMGYLLAELQSVARAHPEATW